jgi:hypothetical protein
LATFVFCFFGEFGASVSRTFVPFVDASLPGKTSRGCPPEDVIANTDLYSHVSTNINQYNKDEYCNRILYLQINRRLGFIDSR